ncbi:ganglioside GM2 activator [Lampetra fluviatilis]
MRGCGAALVVVVAVAVVALCAQTARAAVWPRRPHWMPPSPYRVFSAWVHPTRQHLKVKSFAWNNCGPESDVAILKSLQISPDPVIIPGDLTVALNGVTTVTLAGPIEANVTLDKELAGLWIEVPCLDQIGSCVYKDVCQLLNQLTPPGQDCPEPLFSYGLPCNCPFKKGKYNFPESDFTIPYVELPSWLTNGNYRSKVTLSMGGKEVACLKLSLSLHAE